MDACLRNALKEIFESKGVKGNTNCLQLIQKDDDITDPVPSYSTFNKFMKGQSGLGKKFRPALDSFVEKHSSAMVIEEQSTNRSNVSDAMQIEQV